MPVALPDGRAGGRGRRPRRPWRREAARGPGALHRVRPMRDHVPLRRSPTGGESATQSAAGRHEGALHAAPPGTLRSLGNGETGRQKIARHEVLTRARRRSFTASTRPETGSPPFFVARGGCWVEVKKKGTKLPPPFRKKCTAPTGRRY